MINLEQFANQEVQGMGSTEYVPVPASTDGYNGIVKKVALRDGVSDKNGEQWIALDITWIVDDAGVREEMEREEVTLRDSMFLNFTDDGRLDNGKGKNVPLNRLREATGLADPDLAFRFSMLEGKVARIFVVHKTNKNTGAPQAEINKVAALV
jgi:hypothetical protein